MDTSIQFLKEELSRKGIRASYQRMRVLGYLYQSNSHPTADEIYQHLSPEIPSLSRTTIYNILGVFVKAGLIRTVGIEDDEKRFDLVLSNHGHFKCEACGAITDFEIDIDSIPINGLNSFQIKEKDVYFKGWCPKCTVQKE
jgi:Fur family transcriptional regulator, peroxide stress response regulator